MARVAALRLQKGVRYAQQDGTTYGRQSSSSATHTLMTAQRRHTLLEMRTHNGHTTLDTRSQRVQTEIFPRTSKWVVAAQAVLHPCETCARESHLQMKKLRRRTGPVQPIAGAGFDMHRAKRAVHSHLRPCSRSVFMFWKTASRRAHLRHAQWVELFNVNLGS